MNIHNIDMTLNIHGMRTPPPSILLLPHYRNSSSLELRSRQQQPTRHSSNMFDLHVNKVHIHDTTPSSYGWRRYSDRITRLNPAPDIAYRNTYLEGIKRGKSMINTSRSSSPYLTINNSCSYLPLDLLQKKPHSHQYCSIYDYLHDSIRQIEQQRNLKRDISFNVKRPQNEDLTLRHVLSKRKLSAKTSSTTSSLSNNELKNSETVVNYMNHFRVVNSTTPNQTHRQQKLI